MLFTRSKDISNRFSNNPGPAWRLRITPASLQQIIKDSRVPIPPPAARGAATPGLRQNPEGKTGKSFVAFKRCLSAMPQVQPALSEIMGFKVRPIEGLHELEPLRWSSETLLLSVRSLDRLQDIISTVEGETTAQSLVLDRTWGEGIGDAVVTSRLRANSGASFS